MTHPFAHRRLGEILVAKNFAGAEEIDSAMAAGGGLLGERLLQRQAVTPAQLADALAEQYNLPYVDLSGFALPLDLFESIPATRAYQLGVVPYRRIDGVLEVVTADPGDVYLTEKLERLSGLEIRLLIGTAEDIAAAMKRSEGGSEILRDVSEDFRLEIVKEDEEGREEAVSLDAIGQSDSPVIKLVNTILIAALQKRASDVHIEIFERGITVKNRIDGVLYPATDVLDRRHHSAVISRLKVMSELDIAEKRIPQDGRFKLRVNGRNIDFRVSILPSIHGEDVVIRILDKATISKGLDRLSLDQLGMDPEVLTLFRRNIRKPYGMILITGPTGSGKTTTLYGALNELNAEEEKIITIEDPIEYELDGIVQVPVNEKKNLTFARGLRSILRHDPDKIMVGEIRDSETVQIAVQSALTGHLVFTTVHANSVFDVIGRFSHMGVDVYHFVSSLNCVMAQRLVRKVCTQCKRPAPPDPKLLAQSGVDAELAAAAQWCEGEGCEHCGGTGYRDRAAVAELLNLSWRLRELIVERRPVGELQSAAMEEGLVPLRQAALNKALAGETTLREVNRVTLMD